MAIATLGDLGLLLPVVKGLGRRNEVCGIQDAQAASVGGALPWTFGKGLGNACTPEVAEARTKT